MLLISQVPLEDAQHPQWKKHAPLAVVAFNGSNQCKWFHKRVQEKLGAFLNASMSILRFHRCQNSSNYLNRKRTNGCHTKQRSLNLQHNLHRRKKTGFITQYHGIKNWPFEHTLQKLFHWSKHYLNWIIRKVFFHFPRTLERDR